MGSLGMWTHLSHEIAWIYNVRDSKGVFLGHKLWQAHKNWTKCLHISELGKWRWSCVSSCIRAMIRIPCQITRLKYKTWECSMCTGVSLVMPTDLMTAIFYMYTAFGIYIALNLRASRLIITFPPSWRFASSLHHHSLTNLLCEPLVS